MNTALLKGMVSLVFLFSASVGGFFLYSNLNSDVPIHNTASNASLSKANEVYQPGTIGGAFSNWFLSIRAVDNKSSWENKKHVAPQQPKDWTEGSFFKGISKNDSNFVIKLKKACGTAYKTTIPEGEDNKTGMFLISIPKWREVWIMCGKTSTTTGLKPYVA